MKRPSAWFYLLAFLLPLGGCLVTASSLLMKGTGGISDKVSGMQRVLVPGDVDVTLAPGRYNVFYEHRSIIDGAIYASGDLNDLRCGLHDAAGTAVALEHPSGSMTYSFADYAGAAIFVFDSPLAGTYKLSCHLDANSSKVVLAFMHGSFGLELIKTIVPVIIGSLFGLGAFLTILILRRRREPLGA